jgi:drug/metabolite transporter (DMT)-like permease
VAHAAVTQSVAAGPGRALTLACCALLCLIWGSTWLVIKLGLRDLPPFTGASLRFLLAAACMSFVAWRWGAREGGGPPPRVAVIAHGLFQFTLNYGLVYVSETSIPSGLVSVLWSVFPLFVALGAHFVLRSERLTARQWAGMVLAFAGVASLFITDIAVIDGRAVRLGALLLLAPLSVTVSTLLIKQRAAGSSSLLLNRDALWIGAACLGCGALLLERDQPAMFSLRAVASIVYLAVPGTVLTFGLYLWLLRYVPAYRMSLVAFVTPLVALFVGAAFGHERIELHTVFGTALLLSGVLLVVLRRSRQVTPGAGRTHRK